MKITIHYTEHLDIKIGEFFLFKFDYNIHKEMDFYDANGQSLYKKPIDKYQGYMVIGKYLGNSRISNQEIVEIDFSNLIKAFDRIEKLNILLED